MTVLLYVLAYIAGYVAVGAFYARSQAVKCWKRAKTQNPHGMVNASFAIQMAWRVAAWPYAVPFDLSRTVVRAWLRGPVAARKTKAEQLRAEADWWRGKLHHGAPAEQEMAGKLAELCEQRAAEVDL